MLQCPKPRVNFSTKNRNASGRARQDMLKVLASYFQTFSFLLKSIFVAVKKNSALKYELEHIPAASYSALDSYLQSIHIDASFIHISIF